MPLLDHFRPPIYHETFWTSFHNTWAVHLAVGLNKSLPPDYIAQPTARFDIEIDVATLKKPNALADASWAPSPPTGTTELAVVGDEIEIPVYFQLEGMQLVGAVEIVSPTNKSGPGNRIAFVDKCVGMLRMGVGVTIIDIVTHRLANLHDEIIARIGGTAVRTGSATYAAAYRPVERDDSTWLDYWHHVLAVGGVLPTMPLWFGNNQCLPLDLESTYMQTCESFRLAIASPGQTG